MNNNFEKEYFLGKQSNFKRGYKADPAVLALAKERKEMMKKYLKDSNKKISILEIGCAFGYFLNLCDKEGWSTYGIDISKYAISQAKKITKAELKVLDASKDKFPYRDNFFDIIAAYDIVEHLADHEIFFQEISRALKPGGLLVITSAYGEAILDRDKTHINIKNEIELENDFKRHGLKVKKIIKDRLYVRIIPFRRFRIINYLNKKVSDLLGLYLKPLIMIAKKNEDINAK